MPRVHIPEDKPIPEAWYRAIVHEITSAQTGKGDEMWKIRLRIAEGEHADREVKDNLVFSTAAARRLRVFAKAFGLPYEGDVDFEAGDIEDREVMIQVVQEEYKGETQSKVSFAGYKAAPKREQERGPVDDGDRDIPF
jgi:hypothetical protein